jgi:hypothetical protein
LTKIPGLKSYEDFKTVDRVVYLSFQAAYAARGFVENDADWTECFREAAIFAVGSQFRSLFIIALV